MKSKFNFRGVHTAIVTPFTNNQVDYDSFAKLVKYQIDQGIEGLVINGTTGESPTLDSVEIEKCFLIAQEIAGQKIPLTLGVGTNSTHSTLENLKLAKKLNADAVLVVVPYYNKPSQRGLYAHFTQIAEASQVPVILYNVPGRTITKMSAELIVQLSQHSNILGIKEASGDLEFFDIIKNKVRSDFVLLSGDDPTYLPFMQKGGHGLISVMSNIIPALSVKWGHFNSNVDYQNHLQEFEKYAKFIQLMYCEANPVPIKWMLSRLNLIAKAEMRLPLIELDPLFHTEIENELKKIGLLK